MSMLFGLMADLLVSVLLVATIVTSLRLSRRIAGMKVHDAAMRATIGDLAAATDTAERAIQSLRGTLSECDRTLGERLRLADQHAAALSEKVAQGEALIGRVEQIAALSRKLAAVPAPPLGAAPEKPLPPADVLKSAAESVQAVAERAARRLANRAAA
ncbi:MAG: glutamyl-tRNA reductase [Methylobacteriaceae bacterium]|nr:glutamyl-tRNA reductase [Methylobacteriaceae bacterium]